jgi:prepilin-type N-terminal cleavage/methylation domain-containing protein
MTTKKIKGFTIVELLISLAITAMIMTSVAFALNASFDNYGENKKIYQAVNNARQALTRMTSEMRTAMVNPANSTDQSFCTLTWLPDVSKPDVTYRYESDESKLYLNSGGVDYLLCDNVTAMTFKKDLNTTVPADVKSVVISMTVQAGDVSQTLSAAAIIRKVLN